MSANNHIHTRGLRLPAIVGLLVIGLLLLSGSCVSVTASAKPVDDSAQSDKLKLMSRTAGQMFQLTKEEKYAEAKERLMQFSEQMTNVTYSHISVEGLNALTQLVTEARTIYAQVKFSREQGLLVSAKLMLAADALHNQQAPIWHDYYKVFQADAALLQTAIREKDLHNSATAMQQFDHHYQIIRPAVLISRSPELVEKLDSWFVFMQGLLTSGRVDYNKAAAGSLQTESWMPELFTGEQQAIGMPAVQQQPLVLASILLGSIILVLVYVAWRKYQYQEG